MKNFSKLVVAAVLMFAATSFASDATDFGISGLQQIRVMADAAGLNWKVGDTLDFKLDVGGLGQGTLKIAVTKDASEGYTLVEDVDIMGQKENIEALVDRMTGKILKLKVNGQDQTPPDESGTKIIKQEQARITVPKGTFDCIHVVIQDAQGQQSEVWINPQLFPISGMLKETSVQQGMTVTMELTNFVKIP